MTVTALSAVTLAVTNMARSVAFYQALGFEMLYGGAEEDFTSFRAGDGYLNLAREPRARPAWWGRAIFYVEDVDAQYARAVTAGIAPQFTPRDAIWQERYFHVTDPDGHELSFARPITKA